MPKKLSMTPRAVARRASIEREKERCKCLDCGSQTAMSRNDEYYMVHDNVWLEANPKSAGMLCIGCLEDRIGRRLTPDDFTDCPLNQSTYGKSERLISRLQRTDMYDLLDAIKAVIAASDPTLRKALVETFAAYENDSPNDYRWATGPKAPTLLNHLMICCHPINA